MASSKANRNSKNLKDRISEDLAQLVEHEECIWNLKHPDYKSHDTRAQACVLCSVFATEAAENLRMQAVPSPSRLYYPRSIQVH